MRAQQSFLAPLFRGNFKAAAARRFTRTRSVWTASTSSSSPSPFTVNKSINPTTNNNVNTPTQQPLYINTRSHSSSSSLFSSHSPVNSQLSTLLTQTASRFISHTSSPHHRDSNDRSDSHNGDFASRSPYAMKASSKSKSRQPSFVNNLNSTHRARELRKKESFLQQLVVKREEEDNLANYEGTDATCVEFALLVNRGKFDEAYKMFELHGDDFPAALWNIMLSRLYTMKRYDEAISVFRDMRSKGLANEVSSHCFCFKQMYVFAYLFSSASSAPVMSVMRVRPGVDSLACASVTPLRIHLPEGSRSYLTSSGRVF